MSASDESRHFIRQMIDEDNRTGKYGGKVVTRFPPEPNGYLHIGHAKAICLNFGLAEEYGGQCHLRFDDTNPEKEEQEYVDAIQADIRWLGFDWGEHLYFASDYFEKMYALGELLITKGKAYVDSQSVDEIRQGRGSLTEPGTNSPYRERSVEENLDLFRRMRAGEFPDGAHVLRAKGDMAAKNMIMRDPLLYRIRHAHHHRQGDAWCIYPMYDYAHCLEDAIEGVTHSLCTLEFENNRELYDWVLEEVDWPQPRPEQTEFARLALDYTMMSKRRLIQLVQEGTVRGWDDPRMPTIAGLRRRGITPEAIRAFAELVGVAKTNSQVDYAKLDYCIRDDLNHRAPRVMCVLDPLKLVITDLPEDHSETLEADYWPHDVPREGTRQIPMSRELFIERSDFEEAPPKGFRRLAPGRSVRLRHAMTVTCAEVVKDEAGEIVEVRCTHRGEQPKPKGTIHWVDAKTSREVEVRLYDHLFTVPEPLTPVEGKSWEDFINPESLVIPEGARIEPSVFEQDAGGEGRFQFERHGYFYRDPVDSTEDAPVFNLTVRLKDKWARRTAEATPEPQHERVSRRDTRPDRKSATEARAEARAANPSLAAAYGRLQAQGLSESDADFLTGRHDYVSYFDAAVAAYDAPVSVAKWVLNAVVPESDEGPLADTGITPEATATLAKMVDEDRITAGAAKAVFAQLAESGGDPEAIVRERGLEKVSDADALQPIVDAVIAAHPDEAARYREGKKALIGFFVGQVMRRAGKSADAKQVRELLVGALG